MAIYQVILDPEIHYWSAQISSYFNEYTDKLDEVKVEHFREDYHKPARHEYRVFVDREKVEDAFSAGVKLIQDFISR